MAKFVDEVKKYGIYFIHSGSCPEEASDLLKFTFEAVEFRHLNPTWITEKDCLQNGQCNEKIYVLENFGSEVFNIINRSINKLLGPLAILQLLKFSETFPRRFWPVYSLAMNGIVICCSNLQPNSRIQVKEKVELMGGHFERNFTGMVSHLVVGEVGSEKYRAAAVNKIPIMTPEWITDLWENGQHQHHHASDNVYNKYKCPVFKGLIISVSQFDQEERLTLKKLIEDNGGSYRGDMAARDTTHLVLHEPSGAKYVAAKKWSIFCVNPKWVFDSIETGYCCNEDLYAVDDSAHTESKIRNHINEKYAAHDSVHEYHKILNHEKEKYAILNHEKFAHHLGFVDTETEMMDPVKEKSPIEISGVNSSASTRPLTEIKVNQRSEVFSPALKKMDSLALLQEFDLSSLPKYGEFLDGYKIFCFGFKDQHMIKLRRIVNCGGGMIFKDYSDSISHVVCSKLSSSFVKILLSSSVKPFVVSYHWLLECCKAQASVDEKAFECIDTDVLNPEEVETKAVEPEKLIKISQNRIRAKNEDITTESMLDIFNQYISSSEKENEKPCFVQKNYGIVECEVRIERLQESVIKKLCAYHHGRYNKASFTTKKENARKQKRKRKTDSFQQTKQKRLRVH